MTINEYHMPKHCPFNLTERIVIDIISVNLCGKHPIISLNTSLDGLRHARLI